MATTKKADEKHEGFTAEERAAMKDRAKETKRGSRASKADTEQEVLAKIAEMADDDRLLAERVHAIVTGAAPELTPKLWYGMPAYAKNGKVLCHFQSAAKFKSKYATLGFSDQAALDDGNVWATAFALTKLTKADEERISDLVKRAVS
ncbi:iron chaperone [Streptomyces sp. NPDC051684]|uniref:iron chaperone n=1 Tax=Streptomyces sp. NPDC051684 TaxID=3365670 RepID=UPI0037A742EA